MDLCTAAQSTARAGNRNVEHPVPHRTDAAKRLTVIFSCFLIIFIFTIQHVKVTINSKTTQTINPQFVLKQRGKRRPISCLLLEKCSSVCKLIIYGSVALLSFRSRWVWYKCVKEWEYFSMWGWKEVRRLSHWVFLYMDQLCQKIHIPGLCHTPLAQPGLGTASREHQTPLLSSAPWTDPEGMNPNCVPHNSHPPKQHQERKTDFSSWFVLRASRRCLWAQRNSPAHVHQKGKLFP